ncbi:pyridoxamine 5'-phosphate oxidase family protein [uncultured Devosia sp.]|uniref:pyridoxamine 5'-phosphate oxidase family protein n=1 Tax=uncultured Devosia sp. TaxID=211434 RepID=UPI0035C9B1AD
MASTAAPTQTTPITADDKPAAPKAGPAKKPAAKRTAPAKPAAVAKPAKPAATAKPAAPAAPATAAKSRDTSKSLKAHGEHVERIWDLAKRIGVCMFVTWDGERQRSRPLQANVDRGEQAIYFLTDVDSHKDDEVGNFPIVTLAFADIPHSKYISITGKAVVSNDRAKIKELWSPFAQAWWDNADDPAIRLITVSPQDAELWDSPGRVISAISMLAAAVTRRSPKIGENAKVKL